MIPPTVVNQKFFDDTIKRKVVVFPSRYFGPDCGCPERFLLGVRLLRPSAGGGERHHRGLETVVVRVARTSDERTGEGQGRAVVLDATVRSRGTAQIQAWELLEEMPAIVAMERYCDEVEMFNENWYQLMTKNMTYETKAKMLTMADECSEEYYLQVGNGLLIPPREKKNRRE